jgi:hypothetical protein
MMAGKAKESLAAIAKRQRLVDDVARRLVGAFEALTGEGSKRAALMVGGKARSRRSSFSLEPGL